MCGTRQCLPRRSRPVRSLLSATGVALQNRSVCPPSSAASMAGSRPDPLPGSVGRTGPPCQLLFFKKTINQGLAKMQFTVKFVLGIQFSVFLYCSPEKRFIPHPQFPLHPQSLAAAMGAWHLLLLLLAEFGLTIPRMCSCGPWALISPCTVPPACNPASSQDALSTLHILQLSPHVTFQEMSPFPASVLVYKPVLGSGRYLGVGGVCDNHRVG